MRRLGSPVFWSCLAFAAVASTVLAVAANAPKASALASVEGYVNGGASGESGVWFTLASYDLRFEAPRGRVNDPKGLWRTLKEANAGGRAIIVRFRPESGSIDEPSGRANFVPSEVIFDGRTTDGATGSEPATASPPASTAVARAIGLSYSGDANATQAAFAAALSEPDLPVKPRILALKTLGNLDLDEGLTEHPPGADRDRFLATALAEAKRWSGLDPTDPQAIYLHAAASKGLGDYTTALGDYASIASKWPDEIFWSTIRVGAIYRTLGDYDRALSTLEPLAATAPPASMPYHYHRGWTLSLMGRQSEAAAEFAQGLEWQPDYAWAFIRRACALATEGRLAEAEADQNRATELMAKDIAGLPPSQFLKSDRERAVAIALQLRNEIRTNPTAKLQGLCLGYWDEGDERRSLSPLLTGQTRAGAYPAG